MSGKFSSTGTAFGTSNIYRQEEFIREIVQNEVFLIFEDIKVQIESKIKSIDKNIIELKKEIRQLKDHSKTHQDLSDVVAKIEKIEAEMQLLRYHQQFELKTSRTKSLDKERKPIFRRSDDQYDFTSVILGLQTQSKSNIENKGKEKYEMPKPPLPKDSTRTKSQSALKSEKNQSESRKANRNVLMEDSGTIHRWLH